MKYANRHGDMRVNVFRIGDNLKNPNNGKFFEIVSIRESPSIILDLTPAGGDIAAIPDLSAGQLAAGTLAIPVDGPLVAAPNLVPDEDLVLTYALASVRVNRIAYIPTALGAAVIEAIQEVSCQVRYFKPQEVPQWLTPDKQAHGYIDHEISPPDDPNELFPIFVWRDEEPRFQARNIHPIALGQVLYLSPILRLILEERTTQPPAFRTLPKAQCPGLQV